METGRTTDGYSHLLRDVETDEELSVSFYYRDLGAGGKLSTALSTDLDSVVRVSPTVTGLPEA